MKLPIISVFMTVWLCGSADAVLAADADNGRYLAETCLGCHGVEGYYNVYPSYRVPKLGGQGAKYIESALKAYRSGERQHGTMRANAGSLSDQDIADIGAFLEGHGQ